MERIVENLLLNNKNMNCRYFKRSLHIFREKKNNECYMEENIKGSKKGLVVNLN